MDCRWEGADDVGPSCDSYVEAFDRIGRGNLRPIGSGKRHERWGEGDHTA